MTDLKIPDDLKIMYDSCVPGGTHQLSGVTGWYVRELIERIARLESSLAAAKMEVDNEAGRWQDAIYKLLVKHCGDSIDGGGCDSGDPLDFTLAEIAQGIGILEERALQSDRQSQEGK